MNCNLERLTHETEITRVTLPHPIATHDGTITKFVDVEHPVDTQIIRVEQVEDRLIFATMHSNNTK